MEPETKRIAKLFEGLFPGGSSPSAHKQGKTPQESSELGQACMEDGDYIAAVQHFRRAIEQREGAQHEDLLNLAAAYEASGQSAEAAKQYANAIQLEPSAEAFIGLSDIYKRQGRAREALTSLQNAAKIEPSNPQLFYKLAVLYEDLGESTSLLTAIDKAITLSPKEPYFPFWKAEYLSKHKRFDEAIEAYRLAIQQDPSDAYIILRSAVVSWQAGHHAEAIQSMRLASDLKPHDPQYGSLLEAMLRAEKSELASQKGAKKIMDRFDEEAIKGLLKECGLDSGEN